jgi:PAS domain S-box-containing protein
MNNDHTTILLVEDNPADAAYAKALLPRPRYTCIEANCLAQALETAKDKHVDIIVLDLGLPDSDGLDTLMHIKTQRVQVPIVVLTGRDDVATAVEALHAGASHYLLKNGLTSESLVISITDAIDSARRKQIEQELLERNRIISLTAAIGQVLNEARTLAQMMQRCSSVIVEYTGAACAGIWTLEAEAAVLNIQGHFGLEVPSVAERIPVGKSLVGTVASEKRAYITNEFQSERLMNPLWAQENGLIAFAAHPLLIEEKLVGVMAVFARHQLPDSILSGLGPVANQIALGIERKLSDEEATRSAAQARAAELQLKQALTASLTGTWIRDAAAGTIICGETMRTLLGVGDDFPNTFDAFISIVHAEDQAPMLRAMENAVEHHCEYQHEFRVTGENGDVRWICFRGKPYFDENGRFIRSAGVGTDITERKAAEQEHAQLAAIVRYSDAAIIGKSLDGTVTSWNRAAELIYEYTAEEMIGENISKVIPHTQSSELPLILATIKSGYSMGQFESVRQRKNGSLVDVSLIISPVKDVNGTVTGAASIVRDITRQKRTEHLLSMQNGVTKILTDSYATEQAASDILQFIVKTAKYDFGDIWTINNNDNELHCLQVWHNSDPALAELEKVSKHVTFAQGVGVVGRVWVTGKADWIPDLSQCENFARASVVARVGIHTLLCVPILLGTQVLGVFEFFSRTSQHRDEELLATLSNIASQMAQFMDREQAEQTAAKATQAQQKTAQSILENAPIGIVKLNNNLVITEANHAFCTQFGLTLEDLSGKFIFQIPTGIPTGDLVDVVQNGMPFSCENMPIALPRNSVSSQTFWDLAAWPVKVGKEQTTGIVLLTTEVTERVKLSRQREDFVATLTHDLKSPLIGQSRMLELFLDGTLGPIAVNQNEGLLLLKSSTKEMLDLIGTLLEVYRYEDGSPQLHIEELDAMKLVADCLAQVMPLALVRGIKLTSTFQSKDQTFFADGPAFRRVLMNLLDNAIKFTAKGEEIEVSCLSRDTTFVLSITDTGIGISPKELSSLFQRFAQAESGRKFKAATGLGLFLSRQIVEAHGGNITCQSEEGKGTTFVVELPVKEAAESQKNHSSVLKLVTNTQE